MSQFGKASIGDDIPVEKVTLWYLCLCWASIRDDIPIEKVTHWLCWASIRDDIPIQKVTLLLG